MSVSIIMALAPLPLNGFKIAVNILKESFSDTKFEISSLSQRLRIEFEVNVNDILNIEPKGLGSIEELVPQVEKMKAKL